MDQPSVIDQASTSDVPAHADAAEESVHYRDRRRDKPQLSCVFCRRRKVRCDRQLPCQTCINKGIALSCAYTPNPQRSGTTSVGERIQHLEALVRSLVQQQQQQQQTPQTPAVLQNNPLQDSPLHPLSVGRTPGDSPQSTAYSVSACFGENTPMTATDEDAAQATASPPTRISLSIYNSKDRPISPAPSEHGSMRMHSHGANYVGSVHWAAVLDSISELKDHYEKEEEERLLATSEQVLHYSIGPRLLYEPVQATKADILASIPARSAVDRMVARYFNAQGIAPAVLHSGQFLREYESFWRDPSAVSFAWIGLLFSIMCLSTQYQRLSEDPVDPDTIIRIHVFHERTVHCLVLGQFTRGGTHVLETMINHCASEAVLCKDADIGLWLLLGILVQLTLSRGYHRDARNFSNISPFAGEMRRRVWAAVVQMDLRLSSQMGLPRLLKSEQCDTVDPRNLLDSDLDEAAIELPPSRPETEVTPVLYGLAKNRIDRISGPISDLIADTREHPYSEIMELDRKLREADASLPPIFRWQPLSQSIMVSPQIVLHRMWLQLAVQRLVIWLHRKYLAPPYATQARYESSRSACVQAAMKIMEFQQLVDEETQPDGLLHPVRWMMSTSLTQSAFLLGMSVLCYYVQLTKRITPEDPMGLEMGAKVYSLLRNSYPIWLRSSTMSREAREAVEHLNLLLGLQGRKGDTVPTQEVDIQATPISLDQATWDAYQECIANLPGTFNANYVTLGVLESTSAASFSMASPLHTAELDRWIEGE